MSPRNGSNVAPCRFGRFALQPADRSLWMDGHEVALGARAFDVLVVLVSRAGHLVTKDELIALVWPGVIVEENNLQVQISCLRKLLGSDALVTVAGQGYRFVLPVRTDADGELVKPPDAEIRVSSERTPQRGCTVTDVHVQVETHGTQSVTVHVTVDRGA